jgi:hypothetical protein
MRVRSSEEDEPDKPADIKSGPQRGGELLTGECERKGGEERGDQHTQSQTRAEHRHHKLSTFSVSETVSPQDRK